MKMRMFVALAGVPLAILHMPPAQAQGSAQPQAQSQPSAQPEVSVPSAPIVLKVDARSRPWNLNSNANMPVAMDAGLPPKMLWSRRLVPGAKVHITATGTTSFFAGYPMTGPEGYESSGEISEYDKNAGTNVARIFPSTFASNGTGIRVNALMAAFVDADGKVIGKPFIIGKSYDAVVPDKATAISFGVNDGNFGDNRGQYTVSVTFRDDASVTVEPQ